MHENRAYFIAIIIPFMTLFVIAITDTVIGNEIVFYVCRNFQRQQAEINT